MKNSMNSYSTDVLVYFPYSEDELIKFAEDNSDTIFLVGLGRFTMYKIAALNIHNDSIVEVLKVMFEKYPSANVVTKIRVFPDFCASGLWDSVGGYGLDFDEIDIPKEFKTVMKQALLTMEQEMNKMVGFGVREDEPYDSTYNIQKRLVEDLILQLNIAQHKYFFVSEID